MKEGPTTGVGSALLAALLAWATIGVGVVAAAVMIAAVASTASGPLTTTAPRPIGAVGGAGSEGALWRTVGRQHAGVIGDEGRGEGWSGRLLDLFEQQERTRLDEHWEWPLERHNSCHVGVLFIQTAKD